MNKHTPGPWIYEGDSLTHRMFQIAAPFGGEAGTYTHIATVNNLPHHMLIGRNPERALANARLITAAPEMLEALKRIEVETYLEDGIWFERLNSIAAAATAKAEGRE